MTTDQEETIMSHKGDVVNPDREEAKMMSPTTPWYWQNWNHIGTRLVAGRHNMLLTSGWLEAHDISERDRRLIAAAPVLLESLEAVRDCYATVTEGGAIGVAITPDLYEQIEAACRCVGTEEALE